MQVTIPPMGPGSSFGHVVKDGSSSRGLITPTTSILLTIVGPAEPL